MVSSAQAHEVTRSKLTEKKTGKFQREIPLSLIYYAIHIIQSKLKIIISYGNNYGN